MKDEMSSMSQNESTFNTIGRVLYAYRSSLTFKLEQALIYAQDWLRDPSHSDLGFEEEIIELEKVDLDL
ncbi:HAT [Theobroma cacao]|nr:HAT [Theobroma cacao]